ncbi:MAG: F0F1 ATP synthase subunit B [Clostridia bacterium]|nr:F0F1 ATP synthase subunit B [Clostridia bacterium]
MENYLSFVTIDLWTLIFTWGNLLILFLLMKKLLFKPVTDILNKREQEVNDIYDNANTTKEEAANLKSEYTAKLADAKNTAEQIIEGAVKKAQQDEEKIIKDARFKAEQIIKRAEENIELEKKNAFNKLKNDISGMAVSLASKIVERDVDETEHHKMIDEFIDSIGEAS